jgi:hypothetical protein
MRTAHWPLLAALAAALVASGCGGSGDDSQSKTEAWADGVCTAFTSWQTAVEDSANQLKSGAPSKDTVTTAANSIRDATTTLASDLRSLDAPETQGGDQARASLQTLSTHLSTSASDIQTAAASATSLSGALTAASTIAASIGKVGDQVRSTVQTIDDADAKGELQKAFSDTKSCKDLRR